MNCGKHRTHGATSVIRSNGRPSRTTPTSSVSVIPVRAEASFLDTYTSLSTIARANTMRSRGTLREVRVPWHRRFVLSALTIFLAMTESISGRAAEVPPGFAVETLATNLNAATALTV